MEDQDAVKILLVDDRPENLLALEAILDGHGYHLVRATSGEEALKQVLRHDFAVILLDVQMPGMSGFETAELIKRRDKSRHVPIIFLTAISKDDQYVFAGYAAGAVDYLFKPFNPDILRTKVAVFVELWEKTVQIRRQAELLREAEQRERDRQVAELERKSSQRYRNLAEAIPQIVWTATPEGEFTYFNRRWFEYSGLSQEETTSGGWAGVLHPDDRERDVAAWHESLKTLAPVALESRMRRAIDDSYRWHLIRAVPEQGPDGQVIGWIGTCTDIDDRIRAQEAQTELLAQLRDHNQRIEAEVAKRTAELEESNERLRLADQYKDDFLSVISHELRTPLNFIMGFASILDDEVAGPLSEDQHDYLQRILYGSERMLHLVDDLLDFAKMQAGKLVLMPREVPYGPIVDEVVRALTPLAHQKGVTLVAEVDVADPPCLDDQRVVQVLTNLVNNGIKFTPQGGQVAVHAWLEGDMIVTEVTDSGKGICEDDLPQLFVRFKQLDMSATREAGGTGLGLSITKALVEAHGGVISVSSRGSGQGSTFRFSLPVRPATSIEPSANPDAVAT
ncbi:Non-motile and phage-resistance protein [compost metagenome]